MQLVCCDKSYRASAAHLVLLLDTCFKTVYAALQRLCRLIGRLRVCNCRHGHACMLL